VKVCSRTDLRYAIGSDDGLSNGRCLFARALTHAALLESGGYRTTNIRRELTLEINSLTRRLNLRRKADLRLQPRHFSLLRLRERMRGSTPRRVIDGCSGTSDAAVLRFCLSACDAHAVAEGR
jgi:hypothetical protein